MASEGGGGADLVGFIIGLIIFGALIQTAMVQIGKLTGTPIVEETAQVAQEQTAIPDYAVPAATSSQL